MVRCAVSRLVPLVGERSCDTPNAIAAETIVAASICISLLYATKKTAPGFPPAPLDW